MSQCAFADKKFGGYPQFLFGTCCIMRIVAFIRYCLKPFVIDRKNFLFANTPKGANGSAVMFSLIQTAIENGLDPYKYLTWLLKTANNADMDDMEVIQSLLPWNAAAECTAYAK